MDDIDDDQSCAPGGVEWQRGFEAGREQGRREAASALRSSGEAGDIDDDQSCAAGGPEWQRGFEAGREQGRREVPATPASAPDWNTAQHWIDRYAGGIDDELQLDRVAEALRLPDPTPPTSTKGG